MTWRNHRNGRKVKRYHGAGSIREEIIRIQVIGRDTWGKWGDSIVDVTGKSIQKQKKKEEKSH